MHGKSLDDESLLILITKIEGILNSRPLTVEMINDPTSFQPLAPANTLKMKSKVVSHHLESSRDLICIVEDDGDGYNTYPMSSGLAGGRNTCNHWKSVRNGILGEEILLLVTLYY